MKAFVTTVLLFAACSLQIFSMSRTSIASGNWNNPAIWSPAGVPAPSDDTIIVNTAVQHAQFILSTGLFFHVTANGSLLSTQYDTLHVVSRVILIEGPVSAGLIIFSPTDSAANYSLVNSERLWIDDLRNHASGSMCATVEMITSGYIFNYGEISCAMWINNAGVHGESGRFCISGEFIHNGQIFSAVDICDATPGMPGDVMNGPIAASVTYCQLGPCSQCILSSVNEYSDQSTIKIAPHPVAGTSLMEFGSLDAGGAYQLVVTDVSGRLIRTQMFTGNQLYFDRTGMEGGVYFYSVNANNSVVVAGKLLVE